MSCFAMGKTQPVAQLVVKLERVIVSSVENPYSGALHERNYGKNLGNGYGVPVVYGFPP